MLTLKIATFYSVLNWTQNHNLLFASLINHWIKFTAFYAIVSIKQWFSVRSEIFSLDASDQNLLLFFFFFPCFFSSVKKFIHCTQWNWKSKWNNLWQFKCTVTKLRGPHRGNTLPKVNLPNMFINTHYKTSTCKKSKCSVTRGGGGGRGGEGGCCVCYNCKEAKNKCLSHKHLRNKL